MRYARFSAAVLILAFFATPAPAQISSTQGASNVPRGLAMDEVEKRFGAPVAMRPPIGDPPITRWFYNDFTVYFEYDLVIHAVANDKKPSTK